jgi:hypothetical protein
MLKYEPDFKVVLLYEDIIKNINDSVFKSWEFVYEEFNKLRKIIDLTEVYADNFAYRYFPHFTSFIQKFKLKDYSTKYIVGDDK